MHSIEKQRAVAKQTQAEERDRKGLYGHRSINRVEESAMERVRSEGWREEF